jgi:hypothetical protein
MKPIGCGKEILITMSRQFQGNCRRTEATIELDTFQDNGFMELEIRKGKR